MRKLAAVIYSLVLIVSCNAAYVYVDDDAAGVTSDGTSWETAFVNLQDALRVASDGDSIKVAQGLYKPDQGGGHTAGNRRASFTLPYGVSLYGGYAGVSGIDPDAHDVEKYASILSGDLAGNDVLENDPCSLLNEPAR